MKRWACVLVAVALVGMSATSAFAALDSVDIGGVYRVTDAGGSTNGGPFLLTYKGDPAGPLASEFTAVNFTTFCLQQNEYLVVGKDLQAGSFNSETAVTDPDYKLSGYSAWILAMYFGTQGINAFDSKWKLPETITTTGIDTTEYNKLQQAVWAGMVLNHLAPLRIHIGNTTKVNWPGDDPITTKYQIAESAADWAWLNARGLGLDDFENSGWDRNLDKDNNPYNEVRNIRVINTVKAPSGYGYSLDSLSGVQRQDLGGWDGESGAPVPEPATVVIWSALGGAAACAVASRRRKGWSAEKRQAILDVVSGQKA